MHFIKLSDILIKDIDWKHVYWTKLKLELKSEMLPMFCSIMYLNCVYRLSTNVLNWPYFVYAEFPLLLFDG